MIGMMKPKASNGHRFILVPIDYFTKWVEAVSYANITKQVMAHFIKKDIICRYGIPNNIINNNGSNLNNKMMKELCDEFKIEHHNSSPYRPKMTEISTIINSTKALVTNGDIDLSKVVFVQSCRLSRGIFKGSFESQILASSPRVMESIY